MDNLAAAVGANGTVEVNGRLLTLRALTVNDIGTLHAFVKTKLEQIESPFAKIKEELKHLSKEDRRYLLRTAYENRINDKSLSSPQAQEILNGKEGVAYMLWLSARATHPDLTYEQALEDTGKSSLATLKAILDKVNGEDEPKKKEPVAAE